MPSIILLTDAQVSGSPWVIVIVLAVLCLYARWKDARFGGKD